MKFKEYFDTNFSGEVIWPHLNFMGEGNRALFEIQDIEKSNLKKVSLKKTVEYYTHLDIEIEFDGQSYSTSLIQDDQNLLRGLHDVLKQHLGKSLKEIGNFEMKV